MMTERFAYYSKVALWVVGIVIALGILPFCYLSWVHPLLWEGMARREAKACLASSRDPEVLEKTLFQSGWVIKLANGEWIAASYHETHAGTVKSLCVAVDSNGAWYESHQHHCGGMAQYRQRLVFLDVDRREPGCGNELLNAGRLGHVREFDAAFRASSLGEAWTQMKALGFIRAE